MPKKQTIPEIPFDEKLILFKYFISLLGKDSFPLLAKDLKDDELLGYDENNNTYFYGEIVRRYKKHGKINPDKLREYDENICRHVKAIGQRRDGLQLKYFQYLGLLFTEMYLDRYFGDKAAFVIELNAFVAEQNSKVNGLDASPYTEDSLNKLCFMCATGSGKTLIMHINILQYLHYYEKAKKLRPSLTLNKIILLTPNEGLSNQHLAEFALSGISAGLFTKGFGENGLVTIIDINKLEEQGKVKTVSVDEFESNNLVLVDEGHKGLSGEVWYDFRTRLSSDGFSFEYSATFKQALKAGKSKDAAGLIDEYGKAIIMDYSYKYFYSDGYGKDYRIYNLKENMTPEQETLYLTGCLLSFYQQLKVYADNKIAFVDYLIEKPLLIFVGNRVTATTTAAELTDVEKVLKFIDDFTSDTMRAIGRIKTVLSEDTGLVNQHGKELFWSSLDYISDTFGQNHDALYRDVLKLLFNSVNSGRLYVVEMKLIPGEVALKIGQDGDTFGVISVGDTTALIKNCDAKGIVTEKNEFDNESMFRKINEKASSINILIGSRKFTEGWNSWRVSTMGLINFAKGEGSQAIQLFGRGVRLRGYKGCLKRSRAVEEIVPPQHLHYLEKLTIFGIKADYMSVFKDYLEKEDMRANENIFEIKLPTVSRFADVKDKGLKVLRLQEGVSFKRQGQRLVLSLPESDFEDYILKNKVTVDCYSKVQSLVSTYDSWELASQKEENKLSGFEYLDYPRMYLELQQYKNEKNFYNVSLDVNQLRSILEAKDWYTLLIPASELVVSSMESVQRITDVAIMLLKGYLGKYFKFHKAKWESPFMEYDNLTEDNNNFVGEYVISYDMDERQSERFEGFIKELSQLLTADKHIPKYERAWNGFTAFDFRNHLYAPLIRVTGTGVKIEVSPVSLTESEKTFVDLLQEYCAENKTIFEDKELYLLRNKSKSGIGFFECGGFYPDFIMWIISGGVQYISFIDPKGIMLLAKQERNPKIMFYEKIKEMEKRLAAGNESIVLGSFILSISEKSKVKTQWKDFSIKDLENKNVLFLEDGVACIEKMLGRIVW